MSHIVPWSHCTCLVLTPPLYPTPHPGDRNLRALHEPDPVHWDASTNHTPRCRNRVKVKGSWWVVPSQLNAWLKYQAKLWSLFRLQVSLFLELSFKDGHLKCSFYVYPLCIWSGVCISSWASLVTQRKRILLQLRRPGFHPWVRNIPWRRKWQPTPVFLPGKSHGQRSLVGYRPWGYKTWTRLNE